MQKTARWLNCAVINATMRIMIADTSAIARGLVAAGIDQKAADAIAEAVVTHSSENLATKADVAGLESATKADIARLEDLVKANLFLIVALYLSIIAFFVGMLLG